MDAEEKQWTVLEIEKKARQARKKVADGRGRPPSPSFVKAIGKMGKLVENRKELFSDLGDEELEKLDSAKAEALYEKVHSMKMLCEDLESRLRSRVTGVGDS